MRGKLSPAKIAELKQQAAAENRSLHDVFMDACGWPAIPFDGKLLITHQDALLVGGKVQAAAGYADHVVFIDAEVVPALRSPHLHRDVLGTGDHHRRTSGSGVRPREMHTLRRVHVELLADARTAKRAT